MRRLSPIVRRLLALAGAAFVGAAGAVAFSAPAHAHKPIITYTVECGPTADKVLIHWAVGNSSDYDAILKVHTEVGDIKNGALLPKSSVGTKLTGTQEAKAADKTATLSLAVKWTNGHKGEFSETTKDFSGLICAKPEVSFESTCDEAIVVRLKNPLATDVTFVIHGLTGWKKSVKVHGGKSHTEAVGPDDHGSAVAVKAGPHKFGPYHWKKPEKCGKPELTSKSDCDSLTIHVSNPDNGTTVPVQIGDGELIKLTPGDSVKAVIDGAAGLVVKVKVGHEVTEIPYTKPTNCNPPLPVTGDNTAALAGAAVMLVSGGAGLFFAARRRRIRFTA